MSTNWVTRTTGGEMSWRRNLQWVGKTSRDER